MPAGESIGRPADSHGVAAARTATKRSWLPRRSVALGFSEDSTPSLAFVLAGAVLGPELLGILSDNVLAQLDPAVSIALAVLGVFVGSGYAVAVGSISFRWVGGAAAESLCTMACVAGGMYLLLSQWTPILPLLPGAAALVLGTCAAASAALRVDADASPQAASAARLADFDDVPLVLAGGVAVPLIAGVESPWMVVGLSIVLGLGVAGAGGLLFERAVNAPERLAFVTGTVILLGGVAAYASGSPMLTGFVAGLVWTWSPSATVSLVESDLRKLQHPLVGVLLIIAGASIQFTLPLVWVAAPLVLCRLTGKLLGSLITARMLGVSAGLLATILAPPGVLGIALALNIQQVLGTGDTVIVSAVTVAIVASELLAVALVPGEEAA